MAAEIEPDHGHVCARQLEMVKYFLSFVAKAYASMNRMVQYFEWTSQDVSKLSVHYESRYKETLAIQESLATTCFYMESLQRRKLNSAYKKSTLDELKSFETKMHTFNREIVTFGTSQIDQIAHLSFLCDREWAENQEIINVLKECEHIENLQWKKRSTPITTFFVTRLIFSLTSKQSLNVGSNIFHSCFWLCYTTSLQRSADCRARHLAIQSTDKSKVSNCFSTRIAASKTAHNS